jgi:hypothetical protein
LRSDEVLEDLFHLVFIFFLSEDTVYFTVKLGHFIDYHIPNNFIIHAEVTVNKTITHAGHGASFHSRVSLSKIAGYLFGGFADNFQATYESPLQRLVLEKRLFMNAIGMPDNIVRLDEDMTKIFKRPVGHLRLRSE